MDPSRRILVGRIGRPHGVRGLVRVVSYTEAPMALADYEGLTDGDGRRLRLIWQGAGIARLEVWQGDRFVALADRDEAARWTNRGLYVPREALPETEADEFYLADLIGLAAVFPDGKRGRVIAVHDYGAGASLEIERARGGVVLIPFTREAVPEIDLAGRTVRVVPPEEILAEGDVPLRDEASQLEEAFQSEEVSPAMKGMAGEEREEAG
jgi:16S rRNA processing protein RimM